MILELAVSGSIEVVEAGGASGDVFFDFTGFGQNAELENLLAEVSFFEWLLEDGLVEVLEPGEGRFWEEFEADGLVPDLCVETFSGDF